MPLVWIFVAIMSIIYLAFPFVVMSHLSKMNQCVGRLVELQEREIRAKQPDGTNESKAE